MLILHKRDIYGGDLLGTIFWCIQTYRAAVTVWSFPVGKYKFEYIVKKQDHVHTEDERREAAEACKRGEKSPLLINDCNVCFDTGDVQEKKCNSVLLESHIGPAVLSVGRSIDQHCIVDDYALYGIKLSLTKLEE